MEGIKYRAHRTERPVITYKKGLPSSIFNMTSPDKPLEAFGSQHTGAQITGYEFKSFIPPPSNEIVVLITPMAPCNISSRAYQAVKI